jgi:hypothetical protein
MSKITRVVVLVAALVSVFGAMSSAAGAHTWTNTGSTNFTADGVAGTLSVGSNNLACSGSNATGVAGTSFVGGNWTAVHGLATFTGCSLAGVPLTVPCTYDLTAFSVTSGVTTGAADVTCRATTSSSAELCHISGSTPAHYTNPVGTTKGKLTLTASNTLLVTNPAGGTCLLGNNVTGSLTEQTFSITTGTGAGTLGPVISTAP